MNFSMIFSEKIVKTYRQNELRQIFNDIFSKKVVKEKSRQNEL